MWLGEDLNFIHSTSPSVSQPASQPVSQWVTQPCSQFIRSIHLSFILSFHVISFPSLPFPAFSFPSLFVISFHYLWFHVLPSFGFTQPFIPSCHFASLLLFPKLLLQPSSPWSLCWQKIRIFLEVCGIHGASAESGVTISVFLVSFLVLSKVRDSHGTKNSMTTTLTARVRDPKIKIRHQKKYRGDQKIFF